MKLTQFVSPDLLGEFEQTLHGYNIEPHLIYTYILRILTTYSTILKCLSNEIDS